MCYRKQFGMLLLNYAKCLIMYRNAVFLFLCLDYFQLQGCLHIFTQTDKLIISSMLMKK